MRRNFFVVTLLFTASAICAAQESQITFDWAFVKSGPAGSIIPLDFKERVGIAEGDLFKIFIRPVGACYVYVFLHDASGGLDMVFPVSFVEFDTKACMNRPAFIPPGEDWFTLDGNRGIETFHLVASPARLHDLESLFKKYQELSGNPRASLSTTGAARQTVLDEIIRLRKKFSTLAAAAEKPVTIAGGSRGVEAEIQQKATRIAGAGFYSRSFRLEH
jgi:hypothetical protein